MNLLNELNNFDLTGEILPFPFIDESEVHDLAIASCENNVDPSRFVGEWKDTFEVIAELFNRNVNPKRSS